MIKPYRLPRCILLAVTLLWAGGIAPAIYAQDSATHSTTPIRIVTQPFEVTAQAHEMYFYKALELALQKTASTHGPYQLERFKRILSNQRYIAEVSRDDGMIDVTWTMINQEREEKLLPIKISLLRGMNSYRVFLIRTEDKQKFQAIKNLEDLRQYSAGSGSAWPDTSILLANGLPVITSAHYELLFTMLQRKRFDYFPRGVYEVWTEQKAQASKGFVIEETLMFHYPAPIYFFVNKNNTQLAERIERGLKIAIDDGSFDKLFFSTPGFERGYKEINNKDRRIFHLQTLNDYED
jgi:Bacterial extracellular solute-binding proteins, family 3